MPKFTVRVELHGGTQDDYETLHEAMEETGFSRQIASSDGKTYYLPWAEYSREGSLTRDRVLATAKDAAAQTGRNYAILVTESAGRTWHALKEVY